MEQKRWRISTAPAYKRESVQTASASNECGRFPGRGRSFFIFGMNAPLMRALSGEHGVSMRVRGSVESVGRLRPVLREDRLDWRCLKTEDP